MLDDLVYTKPGFLSPPGATFLRVVRTDEEISRFTDTVDRLVSAWLTSAAAVADDELRSVAHPALFDFLQSGMFASLACDRGSMSREGFVHIDHAAGTTSAFYPYVWMCPVCVSDGCAPRDCYLPGGQLKPDRKMYAGEAKLCRPVGRMIGDLGAWGIRSILKALVSEGTHFAAGGGHRGEFDLVMSSDEILVLGETKASPLVAFPLVVGLPAGAAEHHTWFDAAPLATSWAMFVGAAPAGERRIPLDPPGDDRCWPLPQLADYAGDPDFVRRILQAWHKHLVGYRLFNNEPSETRWLRFGCGNIPTGDPAPAPKELRVDNTKNLPGIDRTDDIKKGLSQVMLFGRLKPGCRRRAVKTVLFGNLFAETHHEHYLKPVATVELNWPGHEPVWLFDGIVALSRNILNDDALAGFLSQLPSQPYETVEMDTASIEAAIIESADDE